MNAKLIREKPPFNKSQSLNGAFMRLFGRILDFGAYARTTLVRVYMCVSVSATGGTSIVCRVRECLVRSASKLLPLFLSRFLHRLAFLARLFRNHFISLYLNFLSLLISNGRTGVIIFLIFKTTLIYNLYTRVRLAL